MAGKNGPAPEPLAALAEHPERFTLFAALRLLEATHPQGPRLGRSRRAAEDAIRLAQQPALRFAPGELTRFVAGRPPTLYGEGFGLFGPGGPLPLHLTEYADERRRQHQDPSLVAFLNLFHHRMASLFYRAWADASPTAEADRPGDDRFVDFVGALIGIGAPALRGRDRLGDRARLHRAGRLAPAARSREGLEDILEDHFGLDVRVQPFQAGWLEIPPATRWHLGGARGNGRLGRDANLGRRSWQCQFSFRIVLENLDREQFLRLQPGSAALAEFGDLVRAYIGEELRWDLELRLRPGQVPPTRLARGTRLGFSSWLGRCRDTRARARIRDAHVGRHEPNTSSGRKSRG